MEAKPTHRLTQEDIMKIISDNQNFLMLIKALVANQEDDVVSIPFKDIQKVGMLGIRIQPVFGDNPTEPERIELSLIAPGMSMTI
ncbi:hypothetical protein [Weizmannia phage Youna2]